MDYYNILLFLHISSGFIALACSLSAIVTKSLNLDHRWHIYTGTGFAVSMVVVFLTAIPMSIIRANLFLLMIAIFSAYLVASGWRHAKRRSGKPVPVDWMIALLMALVSVFMFVWGGLQLAQGGGNGHVILVFAAIGAMLTITDLRAFRKGTLTGSDRIANHLTRMMAGTIATITAALVTNVTFQPAIVTWLAPTVVITPLIVWWNRRVRKT